MAELDRFYGPWDARTQRYWRFVTTEKELRGAVKSLAAQAVDGNRVTPGGRIMICAPLTLSRPLVIPKQAAGITICASSYVPVRARGLVATFLDVRAPLFTVEGLFLDADASGNGFTTFVTLSGVAASGLTSGDATIRGNKLNVDRILVDASVGGSTDGQLIDNEQLGELHGAHAVSVFIDSNRWTVSKNTIKDGGAGAGSLVVGANGRDVGIENNDFGLGDVTTNASAGGNTIFANRRTGVITAHATDRWRDSGLQSFNV